MYDFCRSSKLYTKQDIEGEARLPSFLCIGAPKCATTWLFRCLDEHPDVFIPDFKEINFFTVCRWGDDYETKGIAYYTDLFSGAGPRQVIGDFSPNLLQDPFAAERVAALIPEARLIVMIRNPIERCRSHYHYVRNRVSSDGRSLLELLEDPTRDPAGLLWQGLYGRQLEHWLESFEMDRFLVIEAEEAWRRPGEVFRDVCTFIGADPSFTPPSLQARANAARSLRLPGLYAVNLSVSRFLATHGMNDLRIRLKRMGIPRLFQRLNEVQIENPPLSEAEVRGLSAFYRDDAARLSQLLGKDYSAWLEVRSDD